MTPRETPAQSAESATPKAVSRLGRVTDARDRTVTQLDPVTMDALRQHDVIEAEVLRAITHEPGVGITWWERASMIAGAALLFFIIGSFGQSFVTKDFSAMPFARTAVLVYAAIVPWLMWFSLKRVRFNRVAEALLKHGRCPHCGYSLQGLAADEQDGATVCPECGCAWNLAAPPAGQDGD